MKIKSNLFLLKLDENGEVIWFIIDVIKILRIRIG